MVKHRITTNANHVNSNQPKSATSNQSPLPPLSFQFSQTILPVRLPANLCGNQHFTARSACSMAWRCRFLAARPEHPTHWLMSTQVSGQSDGQDRLRELEGQRRQGRLVRRGRFRLAFIYVVRFGDHKMFHHCDALAALEMARTAV